MVNNWNIGDKVKVLRRQTNSNNQGYWSVLHRGVVVGLGSTHVKVFNPREGNGDTTPDYAEWFAVDSRCIKVERA